jgi:hypothetical protein
MAKGATDISSFSVERAFVVQFRAVDEDARARLNGRVEHVSSGRAQYFSSMQELWLFMETALNKPTPHNQTITRDK